MSVSPSPDLATMTPKDIVAELDKYIVGQEKAKKAVAIALRNRMRRLKLPDELRDEVAPKNIIMIGPTGVGKTEIARRLAKLCGAPFLKVEATKYTEVGYVGRDVESMVRDLAQTSASMVKAEMQESVREEAERRAEEALLDLLLPGISRPEEQARSDEQPALPEETAPQPVPSSTRERFREMLREGKLEDRLVEVSVTKSSTPSIEVFAGTSFEEMGLNLGNLSQMLGGRKRKKKAPIRRARELLIAEEMDKLVDMDRVGELAVERAEQMGIIFIDEIDKIASREWKGGPDVSCPSWKAPRSTPATASWTPPTCCSSPPGRSTCPSRRTSFRSSRAGFPSG